MPGVLRVCHAWDQYEGLISPKSAAGVRTVPIIARLRQQLDEHRAHLLENGFVFGRAAERPCDRFVVLNRATRVWKAAGLNPISLHECRHTFASLMIAAGVNLKALQVFMGHASITVTLDLYGHLMPGSEGEATTLVDAYLDREIERANASLGENLGSKSPASGGFRAVLSGIYRRSEEPDAATHKSLRSRETAC